MKWVGIEGELRVSKEGGIQRDDGMRITRDGVRSRSLSEAGGREGNVRV